jgi:hypothetical protein
MRRETGADRIHPVAVLQIFAMLAITAAKSQRKKNILAAKPRPKKRNSKQTVTSDSNGKIDQR